MGIDNEQEINYTSAWDQSGYMSETELSFRAASILADTEALPLENVRRALREHEGDLQAAALAAFGIEITDANRKALDGVMQLLDDGLQKAEVTVEAGTVDSEETAEAVQRAIQSGTYQEVKLNGKHSKGTAVVRDEATQRTYLIKPGSGKPSPAKGVTQESASQSRREVAFYEVADEVGLGDFMPRADLLLIDGAETACMELIPYDFQTLDKMKQTDPNVPNRFLEKYRRSGILHKWAVLDFILGNPDRHGQNMMADKNGSVFLIDHGSAFAGESFDPAHDKSSFIPFYLRAWTKMKDFDKMGFAEKLRSMPRVSGETIANLRAWLISIKDHQLAAILKRNSIDPKPMLSRLSTIKGMVDDGEPVDLVINKLWIST
jgi:hypothetical protein